MSTSPFPKLLDYHTIKNEYDCHESSDENAAIDHQTLSTEDALEETASPQSHTPPTGLTGTRLRSYAFAVLTRREYSKKELIEKLSIYAQNKDEVLALVDEFAAANYQSDERVAEMTLRSQVQRGKGPQRIKQVLKSKALDQAHIHDQMQEIDWLTQAYQLKVKKYGPAVATDPKLKAKQARFLLYRGFQMDIVMKVIAGKKEED
ncbi:regulatory protein RecX [Acinetobacter rudis]|uniref:Regulatory protein RecX n=1 Tax=Acinetobacter rudis TaxID=632955 RepID=A0AAW8J8P7_9GAMM|nr:regulatory protein RecX [Acinetobacter rudis]MDQ8935534.1 regulatory protein RecX [Acinetobacter rudis]MDQ9017797.1 regulatory protein RecX [Acinetobacter rudis]